MTGTEIAMGGIILTLIGAGGGIWAGKKGKVSEPVCVERHKALDERHREINKKLDWIVETLDKMRGESHA